MNSGFSPGIEMEEQMNDFKKKPIENRKILLGLLPYWTPQIPAMGMACLKAFLQSHGYDVMTVDVNVEGECRKIYQEYFDLLRETIARERRGNFYNIGHEVMQNHMMAHLHYQDENDYIQLVKLLIANTFYFEAEDGLVRRLKEILDDFFSWLEDYFTRLLVREKVDVLGLSVYKGTVPASVFAFKIAKRVNPRIRTVMGGGVFAQNLAKGTPNLEFFLEKTGKYIDNIIIGEGERLFLKLLRGELPASQRVFDLNDIDGELLNLETAEMPDFSDLDMQFYPNLASYTSRSCPFQCKFCTETVYWGKYRKKSSRKIVAELSKLYEKYGNQLFFMCDSLLNPVLTGLAKELIDSELSVYWDGYLRIEKQVYDRNIVELWRRGGFYRARLGVESGSQRLLQLMHKNVKIDQVKAAIAMLANAGIKTTTYWIIGYPGETEDDFQQTLDLIEELKDDIYEAECNPFGYYFTGQVNSGEWEKTSKRKTLYPGKFREMIVLQTWYLDSEPSRREMFERIRRFTRHCQELGIPNPYSLYDIYQADDRWKKLHKNAVPSLVEFRDKNGYIDENKRFRMLSYITETIQDDEEFGF
jgi:hypothetical protein